MYHLNIHLAHPLAKMMRKNYPDGTEIIITITNKTGDLSPVFLKILKQFILILSAILFQSLNLLFPDYFY